MELAMTRAIGEAYTTNATRFCEEGRQHLEVNDELQLKADDQEKQNVELRQQLEKRDADLKDALALLKHLAEKIANDQLAKVNWRVRFKFRHPGVTKAQLDRSGDPGALARQARVVQRWINRSDVTRTDDCLGIGKVCIVGWKDIPEEELVADEHGDLDLDELVSEPGSQERDYDENEEQEELYG
ncbi:unnamed protein product [Closterium sp. NIES-64]|nr:unnamed protein product [Closterium sp. NIES-64]CAI5956932.1 unnamed protein product [Closterium sp. NIES-65]